MFSWLCTVWTSWHGLRPTDRKSFLTSNNSTKRFVCVSKHKHTFSRIIFTLMQLCYYSVQSDAYGVVSGSSCSLCPIPPALHLHYWPGFSSGGWRRLQRNDYFTGILGEAVHAYMCELFDFKACSVHTIHLHCDDYNCMYNNNDSNPPPHAHSVQHLIN